jgi:hypothetical protein
MRAAKAAGALSVRDGQPAVFGESGSGCGALSVVNAPLTTKARPEKFRQPFSLPGKSSTKEHKGTRRVFLPSCLFV